MAKAKIVVAQNGESVVQGPLELVVDTFATGVHGITGQDVEGGTLPAGTLVRRVVEDHTVDGVVTRYQASTDGGNRWYDQRTHGRVRTRYVGFPETERHELSAR